MEDKMAKARVKKFMEVPIQDYLSKAERFHVSLRKKRFIERSNKKRGIIYCPESSAKSFEDLGSSLYKITSKEDTDIRAEVYEIHKSAQDGDFTGISDAIEEMLKIIEENLEGAEIKPESHRDGYFILWKTALVTQTGRKEIKNDIIEQHLPKIIFLMQIFLKLPDHLKKVLTLILNFSYLENLGDYFRLEKYNFPGIAQEILAEYKDRMIVDTIHSIMGNLAYEDVKTRDLLLEMKFTEHLAFLLAQDDIDEKFEENMACVLSGYLRQDLSDKEHGRYFDCLLPFMNKLLFSENKHSVNYGLEIRLKLTAWAKRNTEFYYDLGTKEILDQLLVIGRRNNGSLKNGIMVLHHMVLGGEEVVDYLIQEGIEDVIFEASNGAYSAAKEAVLCLLYNLSLCSASILDKFITQKADSDDPSGIFDILIKYIGTGIMTDQSTCFRIMINLFRSCNIHSIRYLMDRGGMTAIMQGKS